jgi:tetratricopeptide (TPR) repeat protein
MHTAWLGSLYVQAGDYDSAINEARRSLEIAPDFPIGYFVLGEVALKKQKYDSAIMMFSRVMPLGVIGLGTTYFRSGDR